MFESSFLANSAKKLLFILSVFIVLYSSISIVSAFFGNSNEAFAVAVGDATATDGNEVLIVLCNVVSFLTGPFGKVVGVICVICVGGLNIVGKANVWTLLTVAVAFGILFGGESVMQVLTGETFSCDEVVG